MNELVKRKNTIREAITPSPTVKQRVAALGDALNRKTQHSRRALAATEAIFRFLDSVYDENASVNIDPVTWRILIPVPWGQKSGWRHWGLREWEGRALGSMIRARVRWHHRDGSAPLFIFEDNAWLTNLGDYGTLQSAHEYLQKYPIKWDEWQEVATKIAAKKHVSRGSARR